MEMDSWRVCSSCKRGIAFGGAYYVCSVSTCTRPGTDYVFCSMPCFDTHIPTLRHREAWAEDRVAPMQATPAAAPASGGQGDVPRRRVVSAGSTSPVASSPVGPSGGAGVPPREILVVVSKFKSYVKAVSGMNTSEGVYEPLSEALRALADEAIERAQADGRKTLMSRDIPRH